MIKKKFQNEKSLNQVRKTFNLSLKIIIPFLIIFLGWQFSALANSEKKENLSVSITPPLLKINLKPGENFSGILRIINNNPYKISADAEIYNFKGLKNGAIEIFSNKPELTEQERKIYLGSWINLKDKKFFIDPYSFSTVPFTITIPNNAEPGGHYALIAVNSKTTENETAKNNIEVIPTLTFPIYLKISGAIEESAQIEKFSTDKKFYPDKKVKFKIIISNNGNVHIAPTGTIKIFNAFNSLSGEISVDKSNGSTIILPGSSKEYNIEWDDGGGILNFNKYRAVLNLNFGEINAQELSAQTSFWILDFKTIFIILGFLFIFLVVVVLIINYFTAKSIKNLQKELIKSLKNAPVQNIKLKEDAAEKLIKKENVLTRKKIKKMFILIGIVAVFALIIILLINYLPKKQSNDIDNNTNILTY